jgi:hypothetical protein
MEFDGITIKHFLIASGLVCVSAFFYHAGKYRGLLLLGGELARASKASFRPVSKRITAAGDRLGFWAAWSIGTLSLTALGTTSLPFDQNQLLTRVLPPVLLTLLLKEGQYEVNKFLARQRRGLAPTNPARAWSNPRTVESSPLAATTDLQTLLMLKLRELEDSGFDWVFINLLPGCQLQRVEAIRCLLSLNLVECQGGFIPASWGLRLTDVGRAQLQQLEGDSK